LWLIPGNFIVIVLAAVAILAGHYCYRVLIFKADVYEPMMSLR